MITASHKIEQCQGLTGYIFSELQEFYWIQSHDLDDQVEIVFKIEEVVDGQRHQFGLNVQIQFQYDFDIVRCVLIEKCVKWRMIREHWVRRMMLLKWLIVVLVMYNLIVELLGLLGVNILVIVIYGWVVAVVVCHYVAGLQPMLGHVVLIVLHWAIEVRLHFWFWLGIVHVVRVWVCHVVHLVLTR
jgi:hypothetical protein